MHQQQHPSSQLRLKCIVLGSAGAGKTSLLRRFVNGSFEGTRGDRRRGRTTTSTLGADYYVKKVEKTLFGRDPVLVQLWDTAGRERLKPQRHPGQFDKESNCNQFLSIKPSSSTNKSNYEHRYNNWGFTDDNTKRSNDQQQKGETRRHNTRQKHGRPFHYHRHNNNSQSNEPRGDALFRNIDACLLVYDAT